MTETLAERFARAHGAPQELDGLIVHTMWRLQVAAGKRVLLRRLGQVPNPVQGVRVKLNGGTVTVNAQELPDVVLWADTSPAEVTLTCNKDGELRVWNCWRDPQGTMQAWIGNAGLLVDVSDTSVRLKCSDGNDQFSPTDLEVEIRLL